MELVQWSLNAVDRIFSTRKLGSGEPAHCPEGTYAAGYTRDYYESWKVMCLSPLDVEDVEDIFIFGFMIAGFLLIGLGIALVYRRIGKVAALNGAPRLPTMTMELSRAVGELHRSPPTLPTLPCQLLFILCDILVVLRKTCA